MRVDLERMCHHCGCSIGPVEPVGRRDVCLRCHADLHCCLNCSFYDPGRHNQCREPQAERQVEKAAGNFCEYFDLRRGRLGTGESTAAERARQGLAGLFSKKSS